MEKAAPQKPRRIKHWKALSSGNFKPMRKSHTGALDGCLLLEMADSLLICIESMVKQGPRLQRGTWVKKLENTLNIQFRQSIAEHFSWAGLENSEIPGELQHMNHALDKRDATSADILLDIIVKLWSCCSPFSFHPHLGRKRKHRQERCFFCHSSN